MRFTSILAAALLLSACVSAPQPPPRPQAPSPIISAPLPPPAPLAANWQDWPITPGNWALRQGNAGSEALFGQPGADPVFTIRCTPATRRIQLSRAGSISGNGTAQMIVRATDAAKSYPIANNGSMPAYVSAETPAADPQLDAVAFSRGRFLVSVKDLKDLVIPAWPEFARVVEDCRG